MRLSRAFLRISLTFDPQALRAEAEAFGEELWRPHPEGHRGNWALPLVAVDGDPANDGVKGRMAATPHLLRSPYLQQVLASFEAPIGRTRLMRIDGNSEATEHVDVNYYWQQRMRVHVPIVTDPAVVFSCGGERLHMAAGECWVFDTWRLHNVMNPNPTRRIHLVADTVGSPAFAERMRGEAPQFVPFDPAGGPPPRIEVHNFPLVMAPEEMQSLFAILEPELAASDRGRALRAEVAAFVEEWRVLHRRYAESAQGWRAYADALERAESRLALHEGAVRLTNGVDAAFAVRQFLLIPALNTDLATSRRRDARAARSRFDRPVFIVSSPRSGSSLLYETLAQSPDLFSIGGESHALIEGIEALHPRDRGWSSNRLEAADATDRIAEELAERFAGAARDRRGAAPPHRFRFLEKTPKNSLRVPFLRAIFPDAFFIYLFRDELATMSSMIEAWKSGRFVTYPELPEWSGPPWSLLLVPGWRESSGRPLAEVVTRQWETATRRLLDDLEALPRESWCVASYDGLIAEPEEEIRRLCDFVGVRWDRPLTVPLPQSSHTLTPPDPEKWRANYHQLEPWQHLARETVDRARDLFARSPLRRASAPPPPPPAAPAPPDEPHAFRSVHTTNVPQILQELGSSLLVSTYQSGRVVSIRADGPQLNTHFRLFPSAMGVAVTEGRVAIGTLHEVWDYWNVPAAAARLHPPKYDACFVPRNMHVTGDIRIHEVAFGTDDELWLVNTRFSTLCTLHPATSFVPRWRPRFVTRLAPEDRCHLNGLAMESGRPRFVTALGATDQRDGWRENKAAGGVVIDVPSNEIVITGLSMPHSPRLYEGKLWLLESAKGTLVSIDPSTGRVETVAELPGFTRGLAFAGPLAFIGLSQVRESVFDGIPLSARLRPEERSCGIWIVNIHTGRVVGFVRFEGDVQEIFDVQLLPGIRYPELLESGADLVGASFVLPDDALADLPDSDETIAS